MKIYRNEGWNEGEGVEISDFHNLKTLTKAVANACRLARESEKYDGCCVVWTPTNGWHTQEFVDWNAEGYALGWAGEEGHFYFFQ